MNYMQFIGPLRPFIVLLISALAFKWVKPDDVGPLADTIIQALAALVTLGVMLWSFRDHRTDKQIDRVAKMREVRSVETDDHVANTGLLASNPKVVSPKKNGGSIPPEART